MANPPSPGGTPRSPVSGTTPPMAPVASVRAAPAAPAGPVAPAVPPLAARPATPGAPTVPPLPAKPARLPSPASAAPVSSVVAKAKAEQAILANIERLPSLPSVLLEVMRRANDPRSCAGDFENILRQDQILTARVLKLVNSSFFGRMRKITTLSESVVVLGFSSLKSIVTAASTSKILMKKMEGYNYGDYGLWKHSFAAALSAKILGQTLKLERSVADEVFVAGLLHDIGKLILDPLVRERLRSFKDEVLLNKNSILDAERKVLEFDHTEIGVKVSQKWKLPQHVEEAILAHHDVERSKDCARSTAVVHLANHFMNSAGIGLAANKPRVEAVHPKALEALGIGADALPGLNEKIAPELDNIRVLCDQLSA